MVPDMSIIFLLNSLIYSLDNYFETVTCGKNNWRFPSYLFASISMSPYSALANHSP